ncbi:MAG: universal stress protein [Fimbriimonadales bacterium]
MKTILMAYRGTDQDKRVLRWLCRYAKQKRAELKLVYVLTVGFSHEVDAPEPPGAKEAEQTLLEAEHIAHEEGLIVSADLVQSREAGTGLVEEAEVVEADLLVMTDTRQIILDDNPLGTGTVAYVTKHAPCPVWVCYEPLPNGGR